ncbi:helix-turn-helix transcriptional regulator [Clostridium sp.]|uniref:helix-turn-helix transcriptional regulator n=1 Tax=Clostridium sp. TaxID=1506 RepID=UPI0026254A65|nr:helix-turn-helix transcriptional regulator [Clostridium sp.]
MKETIGTKLKRYRLLNNMSQLELSKISGVSRNYISEIESGIYTNISIFYVCNLCKTLKITPNDLIPEEYWRVEYE